MCRMIRNGMSMMCPFHVRKFGRLQIKNCREENSSRSPLSTLFLAFPDVCWLILPIRIIVRRKSSACLCTFREENEMQILQFSCDWDVEPNPAPNGVRYPRVGGARECHFAGTSFKPHKLPENAATPTRRVHAVLGCMMMDQTL